MFVCSIIICGSRFQAEVLRMVVATLWPGLVLQAILLKGLLQMGNLIATLMFVDLAKMVSTQTWPTAVQPCLLLP